MSHAQPRQPLPPMAANVGYQNEKWFQVYGTLYRANIYETPGECHIDFCLALDEDEIIAVVVSTLKRCSFTVKQTLDEFQGYWIIRAAKPYGTHSVSGEFSYWYELLARYRYSED